MTGLPLRSGLALWLAAPPLLLLSLYRPFVGSTDRARGLPETVGRWHSTSELPMTERHFALLGTDDATWRTYGDGSGHSVYLVAVYHAQNWKSLHPPHICLEGSDMVIREDGSRELSLAGRTVDVGRLVTWSRSEGWYYLSWYVYGADGLLTGSFASFVLHHAPRALLRQPTGGFLLRVETWIGPEATAAAEAAADERCSAFLAAILPAALGRLEED